MAVTAKATLVAWLKRISDAMNPDVPPTIHDYSVYRALVTEQSAMDAIRDLRVLNTWDVVEWVKLLVSYYDIVDPELFDKAKLIIGDIQSLRTWIHPTTMDDVVRSPPVEILYRAAEFRRMYRDGHDPKILLELIQRLAWDADYVMMSKPSTRPPRRRWAMMGRQRQMIDDTRRRMRSGDMDKTIALLKIP